ncbi:hypothetical protein ACKLNO_00355 [Neisseriaceae bacterium B1]
MTTVSGCLKQLAMFYSRRIEKVLRHWLTDLYYIFSSTTYNGCLKMSDLIWNAQNVPLLYAALIGTLFLWKGMDNGFKST